MKRQGLESWKILEPEGVACPASVPRLVGDAEEVAAHDAPYGFIAIAEGEQRFGHLG
jgi:hypothetical protein